MILICHEYHLEGMTLEHSWNHYLRYSRAEKKGQRGPESQGQWPPVDPQLHFHFPRSIYAIQPWSSQFHKFGSHLLGLGQDKILGLPD